MMQRVFKRATSCLLPCGLVLSLAACSLTPPRAQHLYGLAPRPAAAAPVTDWSANAPLVIVGPVDLPDYLRRAQILLLTDEVEYKPSAQGRWAEPLEAAVTRVTVENLASALGGGQVASLAAAPAGTRLQITLQITEFVATDAGEVRFGGFWHLLASDGRQVRAGARFALRHPMQGDGDAAIVNAMSDALAALTPELVAALRAAR
jgi:uncharacterized lipoprotein YmbA